MDPLDELNPEYSPYNYCSNNPLNSIDPEGYDDEPVAAVYTYPINITVTAERLSCNLSTRMNNNKDIQNGYEKLYFNTHGYIHVRPQITVEEGIDNDVVGPEDFLSVIMSSWIKSAVFEKIIIRNSNVAKIASKGGETFFEEAKYSDKVLRQMSKVDDIYHAFPKSVDYYATIFGQWSTNLGANGKPYQWLKMPGSYGGKTGVFEYVKDANGLINHRFFNVPRVP